MGHTATTWIFRHKKHGPMAVKSQPQGPHQGTSCWEGRNRQAAGWRPGQESNCLYQPFPFLRLGRDNIAYFKKRPKAPK